MNSFDKGVVLFGRQDFQKALDLFNDAITSERSPSLSLLDYRASTHEKLGNLKAALDDAKALMRLYEREPRGYYRAGKLLQLMDKPTVALAIYQRGITKRARGAESLLKLHNQLLYTMAPKSGSDPARALPAELFGRCLASLSFKQLVNATSVSKGWYRFISNVPELWRDLDLSEAVHPVRNAFVTRCLNNSQRSITLATIRKTQNPDQVLSALARDCKSLSILNLSQEMTIGPDFAHYMAPARSLRTLVLRSPLSLAMVSRLLERLSNLVHLDCLEVRNANAAGSNMASWKGEFHSLQRLTIANTGGRLGFDRLRLPNLVARAPNLRTLRLGRFGVSELSQLSMHLDELKHLEHLEFNRCDFKYLALPYPGLSPTLRVLHLGAPNVRNGDYYSVGDYFFPHLEELVCAKPCVAAVLLSCSAVMEMSWHPPTVPTWTDEELIMLGRTDLSRLHTFRMDPITDESYIIRLLRSYRLEELKHLRLGNSMAINDTHAEVIASQMKALKTLDLTSTAVTGYGVKKVVEACAGLEQLVLNDCTKCSGDAIEWARGQGVKVIFGTTQGNGRRVRLG